MVGKTCSPEQIIDMLREADVHINQGISIAETKLPKDRYHRADFRWREECGGLRIG